MVGGEWGVTEKRRGAGERFRLHTHKGTRSVRVPRETPCWRKNSKTRSGPVTSARNSVLGWYLQEGL